jgi:hypothetical protein
MLIGLVDLICFLHEELYVVYDVALSTDSHFTVTLFWKMWTRLIMYIGSRSI